MRVPASLAGVPVLRRWAPSIGERLGAFQRSAARRMEELPARPTDWINRIEIVVPTYNHADYLPEAYASVLEQSWTGPLALTFVDNHSSDRTPEVLREIEGSHRRETLRLKVIRNPKNIRQWGSINRAVGDSQNELFVILNADDILMPDCLETIVETYEAESHIYMLGGSSIWFGDAKPLAANQRQPLSEPRLVRYEPRDAVSYRAPNDLNMTHSSSSFFKVAWRIVGGYLPSRKRVVPFDDRDFQMRVSALFPIGIFEDYPLAYYRVDSSHGAGFE